MTSRSRSVSRRRLLAGLGTAALAAPFWPSLLRRVVQAQEGTAPPRFYLMFTGNGQHPDHWLPSGGETDFTLSPVLEPLAPFRDKLLLAHGLHGEDGHSGGMSETTTGRPATDGSGVAAGGPSIDQLLADRWRGDTPLPSLELGVLPANAQSDQICYSARGLPIPPVGLPLGAFEKVFAVTNEDPAAAERRRGRRRSVLDVIAKDMSAIQGRLGPSSRRLLDEHMTLIREREEELMAAYTPLSCELPDAPAPGSQLADTWRQHHDVLTAAFRCGATRVATLRAGGWGGIESGGYDEIGVSSGHHAIAHGGSGDPDGNLRAINRWHAEQLAYLLEQLEAIPEGDGTALDNTVVVWLNELGLGDFNHHSRTDVHVVIAGGARTGLATTGRFRDLGGVDYQHFLYTLARTLAGPDVESFGDHGNEVLAGLLA